MMGAPFDTLYGRVDCLICKPLGSALTVSVWMVGNVDYTWFTALDGRVMPKGLIAINLLDIGAQKISRAIIEQFTVVNGIGT